MKNEEEGATSSMCQSAISGPDNIQEKSIVRPRVNFDTLSQLAITQLTSSNPALVFRALVDNCADLNASNLLFNWIRHRLPIDHEFPIQLIKELGVSSAAEQFCSTESVRVFAMSVVSWLEERNFVREALKIVSALTSAGLSLGTADLPHVRGTVTQASRVLAISNVYLQSGLLREALAVMNRQVLTPSLRDWHNDCCTGLPEDMEKRNLIVNKLIVAATSSELDIGLTVFKTILSAQKYLKNPIDLRPMAESLLFGSICDDCAVTALEVALRIPESMLLDHPPSVFRALVSLIHRVAPMKATKMFREGIQLFVYPKPGEVHKGVLIMTISSSWTAEEVNIAVAISLVDSILNLQDNLSIALVRIQRGHECPSNEPPCLVRVNKSVGAAIVRVKAALFALEPPIDGHQTTDGEVILAPMNVARHIAALRRRATAFGPNYYLHDVPPPLTDPRAPNPGPVSRPMTMKVFRNWGPLPDGKNPFYPEVRAAESLLLLKANRE